MLFVTHASFGALIYLITITYSSMDHSWAALILFFFGVLTPDIDTTRSTVGRGMWPLSAIANTAFAHRGMIHSLIGAMMFGWIVFGVVYLINQPGILAIWYFLGYMAHLVADSFTRRGVSWAAPISERRLKFVIKTSSWTESLFLGLTFFGIFLIIIKAYGFG